MSKMDMRNLIHDKLDELLVECEAAGVDRTNFMTALNSFDLYMLSALPLENSLDIVRVMEENLRRIAEGKFPRSCTRIRIKYLTGDDHEE